MNSFKTWLVLKLFAHIQDEVALLLLTDRTGEMSNELFDFQKSNGVVTLEAVSFYVQQYSEVQRQPHSDGLGSGLPMTYVCDCP